MTRLGQLPCPAGQVLGLVEPGGRVGELDAGSAATPGGQRLRHPVGVVGDQSRGGPDDVPAAAPVPAQGLRLGGGEEAQKALHAGLRCAPEAVDALVIVADHADVARAAQQLDHPLLRQVGVLVLVDQDRCKTFYIPLPRLGPRL